MGEKDENNSGLNSTVYMKQTLNPPLEPKQINPLFLSKDNDHSLDSLAQFGLQTEEDFTQFIGSEAGKEFISHLMKEFALEKAVHEHQRMELIQQQQLKQRLTGALMLWLFEKRVYSAKQVKELILEQQNEERENEQQRASTQPSTAPKERVQYLEQALEHYTQQLIDSRKQLKQLDEEQVTLEKEATELAKESARIRETYSLYEKATDLSYSPLESNHESATFPSIALPELIGSPNNERDMLEHQIADTIIQIEQQAKKISGAIETLDDAQALTLLNFFNLRLEHLKSLKESRNDNNSNNKYYVNNECQVVTKLEDAAFVLRGDQKIIKEGNHYYLLKQGQEWSSVKENPTEKIQAEAHFKQSKSEIMTLKHLVTHTRKLAEEDQLDRVQHHAVRLDQHSQIRQRLQHQIHVQEQAQLATEQLIRNFITPVFKQKLEEAKLTYEAFESCVPRFADLKGLKPQQKLKARDEFIQLLQNAPRQGPIPEVTVNSLLQHLNRFGIDPLKPSVTSIKKQSDEDEQQVSPYTRPKC